MLLYEGTVFLCLDEISDIVSNVKLYAEGDGLAGIQRGIGHGKAGERRSTPRRIFRRPTFFPWNVDQHLSVVP